MFIHTGNKVMNEPTYVSPNCGRRHEDRTHADTGRTWKLFKDPVPPCCEQCCYAVPPSSVQINSDNFSNPKGQFSSSSPLESSNRQEHLKMIKHDVKLSWYSEYNPIKITVINTVSKINKINTHSEMHCKLFHIISEFESLVAEGMKDPFVFLWTQKTRWEVISLALWTTCLTRSRCWTPIVWEKTSTKGCLCL